MAAAGVEDVAEVRAARVEGRQQHVRVRVPEIGVDAPSAADDVLPVALEIQYGADARLNVVAVRLRVEPEILQADDAVEQPGPGGRLNLHEVRILRLIEVEARDQVVAKTGVD